MTNFELANKIEVVNPYANIDALYGPYSSLSEALSTIPIELRIIGRTVGIIVDNAVEEYWWKEDISDLGLVLKISITEPASDTLNDVVLRSNYSSKEITFTGSPTEPGRNGALGMKQSTYSMYFGNMNPDHTGVYNIGIGYNAFPVLTTGISNSSYGHFAGEKLTTGSYSTLIGMMAGQGLTTGSYSTLIGASAGEKLTTASYTTLIGSMSGKNITTGNANSFFGDEVAVNMTTGHKNTISGMGAAYHTVGGKFNSIFGYKAAQFRTVGDYNVILGNNAGSNKNTGIVPIGSNNVLIGSGAGFADGNLNNKLVIHSNNSLTAADSNSIASEGVYTNSEQSQLANALVTGDFQERWFKLNGKFSINPAHIPNADTSYTKTIVAKPDGSFGWEDKIVVPVPPTTGTFKLQSIDGVISWVADV